VYTLSKWGVKGFTEGLARMLIPHGIVVNGIAPGLTATPMLMTNGVTENIANKKTLTGRYARPEEIADMSVILVSGMCRMVVGDVLYMTGGSGTLYHEDVNYNFI
jgi:NAD(P)-dependent dehydrogenase (short-subunit alcohol dehydrogenase family)